MNNEWIIHEKANVSKEWDSLTFYSYQSKRQENLTMPALLELIQNKGLAVIQYDGKNPIVLTLLDQTIDVKRD